MKGVRCHAHLVDHVADGGVRDPAGHLGGGEGHGDGHAGEEGRHLARPGRGAVHRGGPGLAPHILAGVGARGGTRQSEVSQIKCGGRYKYFLGRFVMIRESREKLELTVAKSGGLVHGMSGL